MVDVELVPSTHRVDRRPHHVLGHVLHALAARAHEVMVVIGVAGDVRGDVAFALDPAGQAVLHLRLERPVHRRQSQTRMSAAQPGVQLLGAECAFRSR